MSIQPVQGRRQPDSLADVLERVLDRGIVIAGDVVVNVLDIELLTLKLRLFIASADTAREMGMDWWTTDPFFSSQAPRAVEHGDAGEPRVGDGSGQRRTQRELQAENARLRERVAALESAQQSEDRRGT
ncbi:MAG: gas vesicle protein [Actinomycetota bacterium]|nr:gas vesicle protein [Actinomycetota bacterium]